MFVKATYFLRVEDPYSDSTLQLKTFEDLKVCANSSEALHGYLLFSALK